MSGSETDFWMITETFYTRIISQNPSLPLKQPVSNLVALRTAHEVHKSSFKVFYKAKIFLFTLSHAFNWLLMNFFYDCGSLWRFKSNKPDILKPCVAAWAVLVHYSLLKENSTFFLKHMKYDYIEGIMMCLVRICSVDWSCICVIPVRNSTYVWLWCHKRTLRSCWTHNPRMQCSCMTTETRFE